MKERISKKNRREVLENFFTETVSNPQMSMRTRMAAAERLETMYARIETFNQKSLARRERREIAALARLECDNAAEQEARLVAAKASVENEDKADMAAMTTLFDEVMNEERTRAE